MIDYSFIRLKNSKEAAFNLSESPIVEHFYFGQVQLIPFSLTPYLQITNSDTPIVLEDYTVNVVDFKGNEFDITESVFIEPFIDNKGISQIAFEIVRINKDFGPKPVYLRFDQDDGESFYSNPIFITAYNSHLTSRLDYTANSNYSGFDYETAPYYQSIQLAFYFNTYVSRDDLDIYYQISTGQNINARVNISDVSEWITQFFDGFTFKRLKRALYQICYVNCVRNYAIEGLEYETREERSNISQSKFQTDADENDTFTPKYQIAEGPQVVQLTPPDNSTNPVFTNLQIKFNQFIQAGSGGVQVYQNGQPVGAKKETFGNDLIINGDTLTIDTSDIVFANGNYHVIVDEGIVNVNGFLPFEGFSNMSDWNFTFFTTPVNATITPSKTNVLGELFNLRVQFTAVQGYTQPQQDQTQIGMVIDSNYFGQPFAVNNSIGVDIDLIAKRSTEGQTTFAFADTRIFISNGAGSTLRYSYTGLEITFTETEIQNETPKVVAFNIEVL